MDKGLKGNLALNKLLATFALIGALICLHYAWSVSGWQSCAFGAAIGLLAKITINRTLKASVYASALVTAEMIIEYRKATR